MPRLRVWRHSSSLLEMTLILRWCVMLCCTVLWHIRNALYIIFLFDIWVLTMLQTVSSVVCLTFHGRKNLLSASLPPCRHFVSANVPQSALYLSQILHHTHLTHLPLHKCPPQEVSAITVQKFPSATHPPPNAKGYPPLQVAPRNNHSMGPHFDLYGPRKNVPHNLPTSKAKHTAP